MQQLTVIDRKAALSLKSLQTLHLDKLVLGGRAGT